MFTCYRLFNFNKFLMFENHRGCCTSIRCSTRQGNYNAVRIFTRIPFHHHTEHVVTTEGIGSRGYS